MKTGKEISLAEASGLAGFSSLPSGGTKPVIREYIKNREAEDSCLEQLNL